MSQLTFYNHQGIAVAYTEDHCHIYLFDGSPVAYIYDDSIYSYIGKHLGRYLDGWVRDNSGYCVFFTESTQGGGPVRPVKHVRPVKNVKHVKPVKMVKEVKPVKPVSLLSWSSLSGEQFFYQ
ncbi:MAG: hypothetical protein K6T78_15510 [Alicyclobacillus sp.]|nr:hypothetical protein [Alicyclobacillus sp.]